MRFFVSNERNGEMPEELKPGETPTTEPAKGTETPTEPKTETVEELKARLADAEKRATNKAEEAARLHKKLEGIEQAEAERNKANLSVEERIKQAEAEAKRNKIEALQIKAATKITLPLEFADRLKGETLEELEADAKKLFDSMPKPSTPTAPKLPITNPQDAEKTESLDQKRARIFGTNRNAFDMDLIKESGGGVVWNNPPEQG